MANVKISALPQYSAAVNPDIYFVNNNSGQTETFKIQLDQFNGMTSTNGNNAVQSNSFLTTLGTTASTESAIAIGNGAEATSPYSIAIGYMARNENRDGARNNYICIGTNARAVQESFALGTDARAFGADTCSVGKNAGTFGNSSLALGKDTLAYSTGGLAIGRDAFDQANNYGIAIGGSAQVNADYALALGYNAQSDAVGGVGIGNAAYSKGEYSTIIGGSGHTENNTSINSTIIGGRNNIIDDNTTSNIIGGSGNTISSSNSANSFRNSIINSIDCQIEGDKQYTSTNVNFIGCNNIDVENLVDVSFINVNNYVRNNGGIATGTTVFQNTYTLGANIFSADTYNSTGATTTITINPLQQDYIEINCNGTTTYNIQFSFVDSAIYANIHLYINYVSGSTINFVNGTNTQWRWAGGSAPTFSATGRSILVLSTWAGNDVWEVSRSMNIA